LSYGVGVVPVRHSQTFEFQTLVDVSGRPYWQPMG